MAEIRCQWGEAGLVAMRDWADALVIVDVLCFSTCLSIAAARGAAVHPISSARRDQAPALADRLGAKLAVRRREATATDFTLSPGSLFRLAEGDRLVLPSANGSALSELTGDLATYAAALRNAGAVARHVAERHQRIGVVAGGERWPDGGIRFAVEDWLGAGAVIAAFDGTKSAEARAAELGFVGARGQIAPLLAGTDSARRLESIGFADDVEHAAPLDVDGAVPMLVDGAYRNVAA